MQRSQVPLLEMAAGFLRPTRSGTFGESLGYGAAGLSDGLRYQDQQRRADEDAAQRAAIFKMREQQMAAQNQALQAEAMREAEINRTLDSVSRDPGQVVSDDPLAGIIDAGQTRQAMRDGEQVSEPALVRAGQEAQMQGYRDQGIESPLMRGRTFQDRLKNAQVTLMKLGAGDRAKDLGALFAEPEPDLLIKDGLVFDKRTGQVVSEYDVKLTPLQQAQLHGEPFTPAGDWNEKGFEAQRRLKQAGASSVNVTPQINLPSNKKLYEGIGGAMGTAVEDSRAAAKGAIDTIRTVGQIRESINSGALIAGPGTTPKLYLRQIGEVIGAGGKNNEEVLRNTRKAMQGLAQLELDAAKQMKGQGQITEGERKIIQKAAAGRIEEMTVPEINELIRIQEKIARGRIAEHNSLVQGLVDDPEIGKAGNMLMIPMPEPFTQNPGPSMQSDGSVTGTIGGSQGVKILRRVR